MENNQISYKNRLSIINQCIYIMKEVSQSAEHQKEVQELLSQLESAKSWIIDTYPEEKYLEDIEF